MFTHLCHRTSYAIADELENDDERKGDQMRGAKRAFRAHHTDCVQEKCSDPSRWVEHFKLLMWTTVEEGSNADQHE